MTAILWCLVAALVVTLFTLLVMWRQFVIYKGKLEYEGHRSEHYKSLWLDAMEDQTTYAVKTQEAFHRIAEEVSYSNLSKAEMAMILAKIPLSRS